MSRLLSDRWIWLGLGCYAGNMFVFHWALRYTSASAVMMLENTAPVVALVGGALLFRERITPRAVLALGLALAGVWLVCTADPGIRRATESSALRGNVLALLAGLTWGGYALAGRGHGLRSGSHEDGLAATSVMLLGSSVILAPLLIGVDAWPATRSAWCWVLLLSCVHTALATALWRMALHHIGAYTASLVFLLTIVLTIGNAALFLHEYATPPMIVGAVAICAALLVLVGAPSRRTV